MDSKITGDKDRDELHMYLKSLCYDCTFSISNETDGPQLFKCHKFVLARASEVFRKMLAGHFQEATKGPDDEIVIKSKVSPTAFDLAMRYLYGSQTDLKSISLAIEVFHFAHEWQIDHLAEVASDFLAKGGPNEILPVFEMYSNLGLQSEISSCLELIQNHTRQVLTSEVWLRSSHNTVLSVFSLNKLNISETELLDALIEWGTANVVDKGDIREAIDQCLRLIRFRSLNNFEFGSICQNMNILTESEKLKILLSINLGDEKLMPLNFAVEAFPRNLSEWNLYRWNNVDKMFTGETVNDRSQSQSQFTFSISKNGYFLEGVSLLCLNFKNNVNKQLSVTCKLYYEAVNNSLYQLESVTFNKEENVDSVKSLLFPRPTPLQKGVLYTVTVEYINGFPITSGKYNRNGLKLNFDDVSILLASSEILDIWALCLSKVKHEI